MQRFRDTFPKDLSGGIDQRTTRVARINRRIGLDQTGEVRAIRGGPTLVQVRNDPFSERPGQAERRTDRIDRVSDLDAIRIPQGHGVQARGRNRDPDDGQVRGRVRPDQRGRHGLTAAQRDLHLRGAGNDVRVGQDVAVGIENDPRADGLSTGRG